MKIICLAPGENDSHRICHPNFLAFKLVGGLVDVHQETKGKREPLGIASPQPPWTFLNYSYVGKGGCSDPCAPPHDGISSLPLQSQSSSAFLVLLVFCASVPLFPKLCSFSSSFQDDLNHWAGSCSG